MRLDKADNLFFRHRSRNLRRKWLVADGSRLDAQLPSIRSCIRLFNGERNHPAPAFL
jgi:hypothetical protein